MEKLFTSVIVPAAGQGRRMNSPISKQYLTLHGKPILAYTLDVFEKCASIIKVSLECDLQKRTPIQGRAEIKFNQPITERTCSRE